MPTVPAYARVTLEVDAPDHERIRDLVDALIPMDVPPGALPRAWYTATGRNVGGLAVMLYDVEDRDDQALGDLVDLVVATIDTDLAQVVTRTVERLPGEPSSWPVPTI